MISINIDLIYTLTCILHTGFARISNVEFYHSGQEGWTDFYDPRYSLAFLDTGPSTEEKPSYVTGCSFHQGFSPAIGVFGAMGVTVQDNIIHHTVGSGKRTLNLQIACGVFLYETHISICADTDI